MSDNGIPGFERDSFVRERQLQFSVALERDTGIAWDAFMRGGISHLLRDNRIPVYKTRKNTQEYPETVTTTVGSLVEYEQPSSTAATSGQWAFGVILWDTVECHTVQGR